MSETSEDAWFYTYEGERAGPLSFEELKELARGGLLNPRLDMVWTQGMAEWKLAGEVEGLYEKAQQSLPPPTLAESANDPYQSPKNGWETMDGQNIEWPGARRRSFYFATLILPFLFALTLGLVAPILQHQFSEKVMLPVVVGAVVLLVVLMIYYGLQRLVNLGMSRWWYLANLVPILNFWVGYRMYVCPAGYAFHRKLDTVGVVLAILYWIMIATYLLLTAVQIAMMFGVLLSPEMQEQIQKFMPSAAP